MGRFSSFNKLKKKTITANVRRGTLVSSATSRIKCVVKNTNASKQPNQTVEHGKKHRNLTKILYCHGVTVSEANASWGSKTSWGKTSCSVIARWPKTQKAVPTVRHNQYFPVYSLKFHPLQNSQFPFFAVGKYCEHLLTVEVDSSAAKLESVLDTTVQVRPGRKECRLGGSTEDYVCLFDSDCNPDYP